MSENTRQLWNGLFIDRIIDSMADGVFTVGPDGRITSWNRSMERISGYAAPEALGKTCRLLACSRCFGRDCPTGIKSCGILERQSSEAKECLIRHKDGFDAPVIKKASVVKDDKGRILGVVETVTDLTELKLAREKAAAAAPCRNAPHGQYLRQEPRHAACLCRHCFGRSERGYCLDSGRERYRQGACRRRNPL